MIEGVSTGVPYYIMPVGSKIKQFSLIRNAEKRSNPRWTSATKQGAMYTLTYSPSGDRIASGGRNETLHI